MSSPSPSRLLVPLGEALKVARRAREATEALELSLSVVATFLSFSLRTSALP